MTATSSPTGAPTPAAPLLPDEAALERLFRARFADLAEEAKARLGDAAPSAGKVVEGAFLNAWKDRAQFQTPEQLDAYLHEAVKHGSAREIARRANAHRFSHGTTGSHAAANGAVSVDDSWRRVVGTLHPAAPSESASHMAEHLRHDTAQHMKDMARRPNWIVPVIIGGAALLVALAGVWWFDQLGEEPAITSALASPEAKIFTAPPAQLANLELTDGTKVTLTPESKLVVPKDYSGSKLRAVRVEGGANFTVAPGQEKPFEVRAGRTAVFATGTSFTVFAYPMDSTITVAVKDGAVSLEAPLGTKDKKSIAAGKAMFVAKDGSVRAPTPVELAEATSWLDHHVTLANRQLRDAVDMFKRWYGMDIKVPDLPLLDRPVNVDANLDSSRVAIAQVESSSNVKFGWEGQNMLFADAAKVSKPVKQAGKPAPKAKARRR